MRLATRPGAGRRVYQSSDPPLREDWGTIARLYDLEHPACRGAELSFWHQLAGTSGGAVLELAAGSGRVAIALARKGHRATGLERSPGMLERARARSARLPPSVAARLDWVEADMAAFDLPGRQFGLVFIAYNSFWLLDNEATQASCLRAVARHLAPEGRFVLDVFPPNDDDRQEESGITQRLALPWRGQTVLRIKDYTYDPARREGVSEVRYYAADALSDAPTGLLAQFTYHLRLAEPDQVQALLEREGYAVETTYGTYRGDRLTPTSPRAIFVARLR